MFSHNGLYAVPCVFLCDERMMHRSLNHCIDSNQILLNNKDKQVVIVGYTMEHSLQWHCLSTKNKTRPPPPEAVAAVAPYVVA